MRTVVLVVAIIAACLAAANAQIWIMSPANQTGRGSHTPPVTTGSALLVDNTNPALLVDGVNPACLVGGC